MLPWCQRAEVDGGEPANSDCADTVEEGVDVGDVNGTIACVENTRGDQRGEGAVKSKMSGPVSREV